MMGRRAIRYLLASWALGGLLVAGGCTNRQYRASADKEVYGAIAGKTPAVPNTERHFTIDQTNAFSLQGLPVSDKMEGSLGPAAASERGAHVLSLEKALATAVKCSRTYQDSREKLYLTALSLTLSRHAFTPLFTAGGTGDYQVQTEEAVALVPDPANPGETKVITSDNLAEQHSLHGTGKVGVEWLIRDVGKISAALTTDFLRFLTGDPRTVTSSALGATFSRPLLRNSAYKTEQENLTQAERDLLYELRSFVSFRKGFSVQVAKAYYGVLGNRDRVRNSFLNLQSSRRTAERTRALASEGRTTQSDLGRLSQQELSAESTWVDAIRSYKRALDDFKFQLGLPVAIQLMLDDRDLQQLTIRHPEIDITNSIRVALAARLDYQNVNDQYADSQRQTVLAADRLKPQLDLVASGGINSVQEIRGFALPDPQRYHWNAGLDVDLPLNRKAERNGYRSALIAEAKAARTVAQRQDEIEQQVRESWRTLEQAKRTYEISEIGVKLAERRVEEQELLAQLGRAKAQDQVDAQNDLANSMNQRTQALVDHTIARLQFWNDMGILFIKENGQWEEPNHAKTK
jgi:outer membrane protein TolC